MKTHFLIILFLVTFADAGDNDNYTISTTRQAIFDLAREYPGQYKSKQTYLKKLARLEREYKKGNNVSSELRNVQQQALLVNPLLDSLQLLCIKRKMEDISPILTDPKHQHEKFQWGGTITGALQRLGLPSNHECNSSLPKMGYDNNIAILSAVHPDAELKSFYTAPDSGYVGEIDLSWDADKFLFTQSDSKSWKIFEMDMKSGATRQVSQTPEDVDCGDACYLPNGKIIFGSTASMQSVPCWHGQRRVSNLYVMNNDGNNVRQACFDQDHDFHPTVLPNGQVLYHRWDYTGINHIYLRQLMVMNPDGTGQRAIYGSNSWFPNSLYFPKPIPSKSAQFVAILSGYHGAHRMGQLVVVDTQKGFADGDGLKRISGCGKKITPKIKDNLVDHDWPKFLHPYPLSDKHFLVSAWLEPKGTWGLYLADIFDNLVLIKEIPGYALLEPVPIKKQPLPQLIPNRVQPQKTESVVYVHDVYSGPGLEDVPRGVIKSLRVIAYNFGYPGMAGAHKIGIGGPWEAMSILGTVSVEEDGSAMFYVPSNTPIAFQTLDKEGKAVQLMRSWTTGMPGETMSCVGCHEKPNEIAPTKRAIAALKQPRKLTEWYGPARGFDFEREVQPVLTKYCISCHDGSEQNRPDLRCEKERPEYKGSYPSSLGVQRMHPVMKEATESRVKYTPAYEALLPYVRRVSIEDDVSLLTPGELHCDTSPLFQQLNRGHHGVRLDKESRDRLITWVDLNTPCHGTWNDVFPVQDGLCERRAVLRKEYGTSVFDPEVIPNLPLPKLDGELDSIQNSLKIAKSTNPKVGKIVRKIFSLNDSTKIALIKIDAKEPFWMAETEITNEQFKAFDPNHDSRYYAKRHKRGDDQGMMLNENSQPVVRVSWQEATSFCEWLSKKSGLTINLPTSNQFAHVWDFDQDGDYSTTANLADMCFSHGLQKNGLQVSGGVEHLHLEGAKLADKRFNDGFIVTAPVAHYQSNSYGLFDITGNAAEWMREDNDSSDHVWAAGGSFFDHPKRVAANSYPTWQKVFNVGFRIVAEGE